MRAIQSHTVPGNQGGALHEISSDVAILEQPTGLVEFSKGSARREALQLCMSVRELVLVCECVERSTSVL